MNEVDLNRANDPDVDSAHHEAPLLRQDQIAEYEESHRHCFSFEYRTIDNGCLNTIFVLNRRSR